MSRQPPRPAGAQRVLISTDLIGFLDPESTVKPHCRRSPRLAPLLSKEALPPAQQAWMRGSLGENRRASTCGRAALGALPQ